MEKKLPRQNSYEIAFNKAADLLRAGDIDVICNRSGARSGGKKLFISFFKDEYEIKLPGVSFNPPNLSPGEEILILHYLTSTGTASTKGEYVSFKNLPSASFYNPTYRKRGPDRILKQFGHAIDRIVKAAEVLGGRRASLGDVSVKLRVFPKVEAIIVLFRGDEEFPPEAGILFNDDIINYLPLEDIAKLSGIIAGRLSNAVKILPP